MKKIQKLIVVVLSLILVAGCGCSVNSASQAVRNYLNEYKDVKGNVSDQIDELIEEENLNDDQKDVYKEIFEKQYKDMKYEITNETYDGDEATVTAQITVYDYYKVQKEVSDYLTENREEFYTDNMYDEDLYIDYKLDTMKKYDKTITYTIDFKVTKENGKWVVNDLSENDIKKIHGIYDYSND